MLDRLVSGATGAGHRWPSGTGDNQIIQAEGDHHHAPSDSIVAPEPPQPPPSVEPETPSRLFGAVMDYRDAQAVPSPSKALVRLKTPLGSKVFSFAETATITDRNGTTLPSLTQSALIEYQLDSQGEITRVTIGALQGSVTYENVRLLNSTQIIANAPNSPPINLGVSEQPLVVVLANWRLNSASLEEITVGAELQFGNTAIIQDGQIVQAILIDVIAVSGSFYNSAQKIELFQRMKAFELYFVPGLLAN